MNYKEKAEQIVDHLDREALMIKADHYGLPEKAIATALRESAIEALRDLCDELVEKYEGQGKTLTAAVMHIRAKVADLRRMEL